MHKSYEVFARSKELVKACYLLTSALPPEEKTNLTHLLRSTALTAHLNILRGVFLGKKKRWKKNLRSAKDSFVIIDAITDVLIEVGLVKEAETTEVIRLSSQCYQLLTGLLKKK